MSLKDEQGQALVYTIIFLIVGSLIVASMVPFLGAGFRRQFISRELVVEGYAAEAGVKRVIADLIRGVDALSPHYPIPVITLNEHTPTIDVRPAIIAPPSEAAYIDPGVRDPALSVIPAGQGYLMRLHHVKVGRLRVNWAYSPAGLTRLGVWRGRTAQAAGRITAWTGRDPIAGDPIGVAESRGGDRNHISVDITDPGIYTIVFFNDAGTKVTTRSFERGGDTSTWILVRAHQDYIIAATAGRVSVSAFVRQVPGFSEPPVGEWVGRSSWITNEVSILSWRAP
jgi:hypothetical protein